MTSPATPQMIVEDRPYPTPMRAAWLMLLLFICANLYNIDRLIVGVLADQIKADIGVSDVQMSLLIGLAYALLSVGFGLVVGLYLDRANRRTILAISLTVWSLATIASGLSVSFGWLFAARALVGLGEAALAPGAMSLIADIFPPGRRGRGLAIYSVGATLGSALATLIPGMITGADLHLQVPGLGLTLTPWRLTFVLCGLAGPLVALLLLLTTREPNRQGVLAEASGGNAARFQMNMRYLSDHASVFTPYVLGIGLFYLALLAVTSWTAVFLTRHFGLTLGEIGAALSATLLASGIAGYAAGGMVADSKLMQRSTAKFGIMMIAPLIAIPSGLAVLAPSVPTALLLLATITFAAPILNIGNGALAQDIVPNNMRGFVLSLTLVAATTFGVFGGPLAVAMATEYLFKDPLLIGRALLVVVLPALMLASLCFALALAGLRRHLERGGLVVDVIRAAGGA